MGENRNCEREPSIYWRDVYRQRQKLSLIELNKKKMISGEYKLNSYALEMNTEVETIEELEELLSCGLNSALAYRNLLFIKITENLWTAHHKNENGEMKHFETIDFSTHTEYDLFNHLIERMLQGPEFYWGVDEYEEMPKSFADQLVRGYLEGTIKPIPSLNVPFEELTQEVIEAKIEKESLEAEERSSIRNEQRINWFDAYQQRKKIGMIEFNETEWRMQGYEDDVGADSEANSIVELESGLSSSLWSISQGFAYRNLYFLRITENIWSVHHKNEKGELKHFENLDVTPYVEHGLFEYLIKGMINGPEYYWGVNHFKGIPTSSADQVALDFLSGNIEPSERMKEYEWVKDLIRFRHPKNLDTERATGVGIDLSDIDIDDLFRAPGEPQESLDTSTMNQISTESPSGYKPDTQFLIPIVQDLKRIYNFSGPLHFTHIENLGSILADGYLYSRNDCKDRKSSFIDGASQGVLDRASKRIKDCVRFYYRPKSPTLHINEGVKDVEYQSNTPHISTPVYLLFDERLIYLDSTFFTDGNATSSLEGSDATFFGEMDWDLIFHTGPFLPEERNIIIHRRQAELLSTQPIELKTNLKEIIFRCAADYYRANYLYDYNPMYTIRPNMFSDKNNKLKSEAEVYNNYVENYQVECKVKDQQIICKAKFTFKKPIGDNRQILFIVKGRDGKTKKICIPPSNRKGKEVYFSFPINITDSVLMIESFQVLYNNCVVVEDTLVRHFISNLSATTIGETFKISFDFLTNKIINLNHSYKIYNKAGVVTQTVKLRYPELNESTLGSRWTISPEYDVDNEIFVYYIEGKVCFIYDTTEIPI